MNTPKEVPQGVAIIPETMQSLSTPTPLDLVQRAVQSGAQVEVMEKLLGLHERWERNEARKAFEVAVSKAKSEIPIIRKGNQVDFTTSRGRTNYAYEDLASIAHVIDPILSKYGLSYRWRPNADAKSVTVTCILSHAAGHSEENTLFAPHDMTGNKNPIQAVGSAVTYLQRYTLKSALGLAAAADDDARSVSAPPSQPAPKVESRPVSPPARPPINVSAEEVFPCCQVLSVKMVNSKEGAPKKWTAYFIKFNDGYGDGECATFDMKYAHFAELAAGTHDDVKIITKPGRKPDSRELVSIEYATPTTVPSNPDNTDDHVPMGEPGEVAP